MEQSLLQKKNKQNIVKLNNIINEYETKLDNRVNQVISEVIVYPLRCSIILKNVRILSSNLLCTTKSHSLPQQQNKYTRKEIKASPSIPTYRSKLIPTLRQKWSSSGKPIKICSPQKLLWRREVDQQESNYSLAQNLSKRSLISFQRR